METNISYLVVVVRRAEEGRSKGDKVVGSGWRLGGLGRLGGS